MARTRRQRSPEDVAVGKTLPPHRLAILNTLFAFVVFAGLIFAALNVYVGNSPLALAEVCLAAFTLIIWRLVRAGKHPALCISLYLFVLFSVGLLAMALPKTTSSVFCWVLLIPILSHLLLGRWLGLCYSGVFLSCAGLIFFMRFGGEPGFDDPASVANVVISAISIVCFSHVYEFSREATDHKLRRMAMIDPLTGLANRMLYRQWFETARANAQIANKPLSLVVADIDHFKNLNDTYGHEAGDRALCFVSSVLERTLGARGRLCRIGGEEFSIILPATDAAQAVAIADELCRTMRQSPWRFDSTAVSVTLSMGVAQLGVDGDELKTLFQAADHRMYRSKSQGRNQVSGSDLEGDSLAN
ncbi:MAG: GGDEF domain-containing protein [Salinisphaera sp.]|nr:GGDEF domain-containing protein [Salinisphaera sp.]